MISKVIGWFTVFLGSLWLFRPHILRGWFVYKTSRTIFWMLFLFLFYPAAVWAGNWGLKGWVLSVLILLILGVMLRKFIGKAAERIPLLCFQAAGFLTVLSGVRLIFLVK